MKTGSVSIGEICVNGVDAATGSRIGSAIEQGLARAAAEGRPLRGQRDIAITLPHGASERQIVTALLRRLEQR